MNRGKQFKIVVKKNVAYLAPSQIDSNEDLKKIAENVIEVCACNEQFLLRTEKGIDHGVVLIKDDQPVLKSLKPVEFDHEGKIDFMALVGEQSFAVVKNGDRHQIYSWTLADLEKQQDVVFEVPVIPDEETISNKREGPLLHYPVFTQIATTFHGAALLSNDGRIYNIDPKGKECTPFRKIDQVIKLVGGASHFLALRQVVMQPVGLW